MSKLVDFIFDPRGLNTPAQTALYYRGKENKHEKSLFFYSNCHSLDKSDSDRIIHTLH